MRTRRNKVGRGNQGNDATIPANIVCSIPIRITDALLFVKVISVITLDLQDSVA